MKKITLVFIFLFVVAFGHVYQKTKIITLAYQIHKKNSTLNSLEEKNSNLLYSFYKKVNVQTLHKKMAKEGLQFHYPRKYVKITPKKEKNIAAEEKVGILAKILGIGTQVEARP